MEATTTRPQQPLPTDGATSSSSVSSRTPTTVTLPPVLSSTTSSPMQTSTPAAANTVSVPPPLPRPAATTTTNRSSSYLQRRDEGLLRDVLEELDRERSRRAELEAQVRALDDQVHAYRRIQRDQQQNSSSSTTARSTTSTGSGTTGGGGVPRTAKDYAALEAERMGYLELLEALTNDQPSYRTAAEAELLNPTSSSSSSLNITRKTLPLHVVRLLEIMPWDEQSQPYLFGQEQVYEWQIWSAQKQWQQELKFFPTIFKTLPIVLPQPGRVVQEGVSATVSSSSGGGGAIVGATTSRSSVVAALLKGGAGTAAPPKHCVLTNLDVTQILNIDQGYPLPQDGGKWQWIGGWRIEKTMDTDNQGWSYSNAVTLYNSRPTSQSSSSAAATTDSPDFTSELVLPEPGTRNIVKRRRKWTRTRVLVDYPHASTSSREYLKLVAQRASLMVSVEKLSEQLVDTKMKLTTLEDDHQTLREQATRAVSQLGKDYMNDREELHVFLTALQETLEEQEQERHDGDRRSKQDGPPTSTSSVASTAASLTEAFTRKFGDRLGTLSSTSSIGSNAGITTNATTSNAAATATSTTTSSASTTAAALKKQQVMDWTKGQGNQLLEKLKQSGAKEQTSHILEKLKQSGASDWTKDQGSQLLTKLKETTKNIKKTTTTLDPPS